MFALSPATRIYLAAGATDLRLGFDGLASMAKTVWNADPLSGHLFLFANRHRNRIKALYWDGSGLVNSNCRRTGWFGMDWLTNSIHCVAEADGTAKLRVSWWPELLKAAGIIMILRMVSEVFQ